MYNFDTTDGANPDATLIQGTDRNLYGTTNLGGVNGVGTVFKITRNGALTTLYSFNIKDGAYPDATLVQVASGNLYGTTSGGGTNSCGGIGCGTVFKLTLSVVLTTLYNFCSQSGCADGSNPYPGLTQANDGNFYGVTVVGGIYDYSGTVFEIAPNGKLTTLYSFCSQSDCADGYQPVAALIQQTNGTLYGTASLGGARGYGTVFSASVGLGPFVRTLPSAGGIGRPVAILGTNLTGATTGAVQVVTPGGTLASTCPSGWHRERIRVRQPFA